MIFFFGIYVCKGNVYLVDGKICYVRILGNDDKILLNFDIILVNEYVFFLFECGIKCLGEFGCCYFFYSSFLWRCFIVSGVKDSVLVLLLGFRYYLIYGVGNIFFLIIIFLIFKCS